VFCAKVSRVGGRVDAVLPSVVVVGLWLTYAVIACDRLVKS